MKRLSGNIVVKAALLIFAVFCIFTVVRLQFENNEIKDRIEELESKLDAANDSLSELQKEVDKPIDDEYIINYAKEHLGLRLPEEIIFYSEK